MKVVVDEMPKHHWDCLFCKGIVDECVLSKRYCHGVNNCEVLVEANKLNEKKNGKRQQAKGEPPCMRREDKPKEELK